MTTDCPLPTKRRWKPPVLRYSPMYLEYQQRQQATPSWSFNNRLRFTISRHWFVDPL